MKNQAAKDWTLDKITSNEWSGPGATADVLASNYFGDSLQFSMAWHPRGDVIYFDVEAIFSTPDLLPYEANEYIEDYLLDLAIRDLQEWWSEVQVLQEDLAPKHWSAGSGIAIGDFIYAKLALLYDLRATKSPLNITQNLAVDMKVAQSTAKERIRRARKKGFLTSPGKGLNGQGKATNKAINLAKKRR